MSTPNGTTPCSTTNTTNHHRQKRMGPAPFASFEDLSDELDSPEGSGNNSSIVRLPGIREDLTPVDPPFSGISLIGANQSKQQQQQQQQQLLQKINLQAPKTPRIDISRASSSSHHDSRDSTPDRELFESNQNPSNAKLGLGFREEGALDLRSSTEELDYQERSGGVTTTINKRPQSPCSTITTTTTTTTMSTTQQNIDDYYQRKDSQCSELGLLLISGRTSRLSSIGSAGSGQSRLSNASHLSIISGQSRSPSPHKMLLETSFCGHKTPECDANEQGTKTEVLEKVLLSRKSDPNEAIFAEGISVETTPTTTKELIPKIQSPSTTTTKSISVQSVKSDVTIKVDEPPPSSTSNNTKSNKANNNNNNINNIINGTSDNSKLPPKRIISKSGVEYIYIPLKGPLPVDDTPPSETSLNNKRKVRQVKSATTKSTPITTTTTTPKPRAKSATSSSSFSSGKKHEEEPKYIRIRLKPDHMYSEDEIKDNRTKEVADNLNLIETKPPSPPHQLECVPLSASAPLPPPPSSSSSTTSVGTALNPPSSSTITAKIESVSSTPSASPKFGRRIDSKTPSPSLSRKSSFASLFRSKETIISPESPTLPPYRRKSKISGILREASDNIRERSRSRSRSKSREREKNISTAPPSSCESIDNKNKQKSVFSIFKPKKGNNKEDEIKKCENLPNIEGIAKVEFKFNEQQLEGDSIRIPLHSPIQHEKTILHDLKTLSSQDSQETVIEVVNKQQQQHIECCAVIEGADESNNKKKFRQSSTSSENIVFSTNLGSNNEIFTTKLPKEKTLIKQQKTEIINISSEYDLNLELEEFQSSIVDNKNFDENKLIKEFECKTIEKIETKILEKPEKIKTIEESLSISSSKSIEKKSNNNKLEIAKQQQQQQDTINNRSSDVYSSESERDSEVEFPLKIKKDLDLKLDLEYEPERKGLVLQQDSYDDELPYVPTTLPLERSAAVPIVPIKQRSTFEMKTYPIERPRSTTPINPSCLEEYCEEVMGDFNNENITKTIEKLKISLPRHEIIDNNSSKVVKSPRVTAGNWYEFAEKGIHIGRRPSQEADTPPPLPPKGQQQQQQQQQQREWINFDEIPERRKPPKRIQTLPSRGHIDVPDNSLLHHQEVIYNYVNPEECKCECHEITARERDKIKEQQQQQQQQQQKQQANSDDNNSGDIQEDELPLLEDDEEKSDAIDRIKLDVSISDRRSLISDSSVDLSTSVEQAIQLENNDGDLTLQTPFTSDLGLSSNRSSVVSQVQEEPPPPYSPDRSPNAFPKNI